MPSPSGAVGVKLKLPLASATTVPSTVPPLLIVTVEPTSAVPVRVGVVSLVGPPGPVRTGALGAPLSIVRVMPAATGLTLPATSVAVAVMRFAPFPRSVVGGEAPVARAVDRRGAEGYPVVNDRHGGNRLRPSL